MSNDADLKSFLNKMNMNSFSERGRASGSSLLGKSEFIVMTSEIYRLSAVCSSLNELSGAITDLISKSVNIEAVALRLEGNRDYNFIAYTGFNEKFIGDEDSLACNEARYSDGENNQESPDFSCLCGAVLSGEALPAENSTEYGSFWTNDVQEFRIEYVNDENRVKVRDRCLREGYRSIAIIPLKLRGRIIGLMLLNDHRSKLYCIEEIELFEQLAGIIAGVLEFFVRREVTGNSIAEFNEYIRDISGFLLKLDVDGNILYVSENITEYFLVTPSRVVGQDVFSGDFLNASSGVWAKIIDDAVEIGAEFERELTVKTLKGKTVFQLRVIPKKDLAGRIVSGLLIFKDVTALKEGESTILEKNKMLCDALDSSLAGMLIVNASTSKIVYANEVARRFRENYVRNSQTSEDVDGFFSGVDILDMRGACYESLDEFLAATVRQGKKVSKHLKFINSDNEPVIVNFSATPITNYQGEVIAEIIAFLNITDIVTVKSQRDEFQERFNTLFDLSPDTVVISRFADGEILEVNRMCVNMFGISRIEAIGSRIEDLGICINPELFKKFFAPVKRGKKMENVILKLKRNNGEVFDASVYAEGVYYTGIFSVLCVVRDISEKITLSEKLKQTEKMSAIGQLVGGVAHDFNNQLTGILGYSDFLVSNLKDPELKRYAENIATCAVRSADLTEKLLAFSRKSECKMIPLDLHKILLEVINMLEHSIDKKITIGNRFNASISTVVGDPSQLQNALLNLGINARDAISDEAGMISFNTESVTLNKEYCERISDDIRPGKYIAVQVRDTGIGMNDEIVGKIFEPFFTTKDEGKGTGMGLAAVWSTVKQHKGTINVASRLGYGTSFEILIPEMADTDIIQTPESKAQGKGCVLLVDDEEIVRLLGSQMLSDLGYKVLLCENGYDAVKLFESSHAEIDLVILDMIMPKMSGREAFINMKKIDEEVKVIITSGYAGGGEVQDVLNMGAIGVMKKPFYFEDLSEITLKAIGSV